MNLPDPAPILHLIEAFRHSKTMFTAVSLGIFDRLGQAPAGADELAEEMGADRRGVATLLDGCAALGLLEKRQGRYANSEVAQAYLRTESSDSLTGYIRYSDGVLYPMWGHLDDAVKQGTHRWKQTFGVDGAIFSGFFRTPEAMREFLHGMHGFGTLSSPKVIESFDLSRFRHMVDLGGGTGHLAMAACRRYPELRATVLDLPAPAAVAREYLAGSDVEDRIHVVEGDFFQDELPPADLYAIGRILHDWNDEQCVGLLRRIFARLPEGGAVLVAEKLLHEDGVGPVPANMQSLNMLAIAEGRERTVPEFQALLESAGFTDVEGRRTGAPLDAVLGRKAELHVDEPSSGT
jgi:acetylserotonin N-methyltransferase